MNALFHGNLPQRLRLLSGLILFTFAATHFINHSLGLFSIDTMTQVQDWRLAVTRSVPGSIVLGLALVVHITLALAKLVRRNTLAMPVWEFTQIVLGLIIPLLLFPHIVNTRFASMLFGVNDIYVYELVRLWPDRALNQTILLLLVWVHGCIGLHFWLRLSRWYRRAFPILFALAVLIPVTALAGFMVSGREAKMVASDPVVLEAIKSTSNWPDTAASKALGLYRDWSKQGFYILLAGLLLFVLGRWIATERKPKVSVRYIPEPTVRGTNGATLLEISRMNRLPHLSICGGRARCSTCRVRIIEGGDSLPPPSRAEAATLASIGASPDVRLACQLRPSTPLTVSLLLSPERLGTRQRSMDAHGSERVLAVLFFDIRGFTTMSDGRLPYDVVFLLNRLFNAVGSAVQEEKGWIDKYLGDGFMAVFGRDSDPVTACRQAVQCARKIDLALDQLNSELEDEIGGIIRVGMGLHVGPLVLGEIGHRDTAAMTVIGSTVNIAARLESATKELNCQFAISGEAAEMADLDISDFETESLSIRGVSEPVKVVAVRRARELHVPAARAAGGSGAAAAE